MTRPPRDGLRDEHPFLVYLDEALRNPDGREEIIVEFDRLLAFCRDLHVRLSALESRFSEPEATAP